MKLTRHCSFGSDQNGSATVIFLILLSIMLILVTAEMRSMAQLHHENRLLEQQQIKRLNQSSAKAISTTAAAQNEISRQP